MALLRLDERIKQIDKTCEELRVAVNKGSMGDIVEANQKLILRYYSDVLDHARKSFEIARWSAIVGFAIFAITLAYTFVMDWWLVRSAAPTGLDQVQKLGIASGLIVQVFAGLAFYLYQRASDQFAAFHICLERTHRYLVAYKIAQDEVGTHKEQTLHDLVCIMANAPMILRHEIASKNDITSKPPVAS